MTAFNIMHGDKNVATVNIEGGEYAQEIALDKYLNDNQLDDDGTYAVNPVPYAGPWCVCLYLVDRAYGGPEEGGWWYTYGQPVIERDLPLPSWHATEREAFIAREAMEERCKELNKGRREISSVLSEGRYQACICEGQPQPFPARRPHYE